MGGGKSQTSTQSVSIPPEVLARYNSVNAQAQTAAATPFQPYGGEFVAPVNQQQQAGIAGTNAAANQAQPYYQAATYASMAGGQAVDPSKLDVNAYMNPYTQNVVNATQAAMNQQFGQQNAAQQAQAIRSGAFGGERAGLQNAQLAGQQSLAESQAISPLYQSAYNTALQTAQQQQGVGLSAAQANRAAQQGMASQLAGLGTSAQTAALQGAQAQTAAGTLQQQTQQAGDTAQYQQYLQQQGYPFQVAQFLAGIAEGTGALSGSTTTTTQPAGFFSDERLKTDVKEIGKTNDGQKIYSYKYKGDDRTQIGLMAQDVEKSHPDAVGLMGGYKTVDYKKATEDAERPARATGGLIPAEFDASSMGGAVTSDMAGEEYARGGYALGGDPSNPYGAAGYVPSAPQSAPHQLMIAPGLRAPPQSGMSTAMQTGEDIQGLYNFGKSGLVGTAATKDSPASAGLIGGQGSMSGKNVFSDLKDLMNKPSAAATGGLIGPHGYADGGDVDPYELSRDPLKKTIEEQKVTQLSLPKSNATPGSSQSGLGQLTQGLGAAKSLYGMGSDVASGLGSLGTGFSSAANAGALDSALGPGFFASNIGLGAEGASAAAPGVMGSIGSFLGSLGPAGFLLGAKDGGAIPRQAHADGERVLPLSQDVVDAAPGLVPADGTTDQPTGIPPEAKGLVVDQKLAAPSLESDSTMGLIAKHEGFKPTPYWDVNHLRAGFGSDTVTLPDGTVKPVDENTRVTVEDAKRDLARRKMESQGQIRAAVGDDAWNKLDPGAQDALTSTTYNYGRLPGTVAQAVQGGNKSDIAAAVNNLGYHNEGVNAGRRAQEASMIDPDGKYEPVTGKAKTSMGAAASQMAGPGAPSSTSSDGSGLIDKATSSSFLVPALGFLGSMLASQRPTLGGALGEGLLGGTGAYMAQQKQAAEIPKVQAQTQLEQARAAEVQQTTKNLRSGMYVVSRSALGELQLYDKENPTAPPVKLTDQLGRPLPGKEALVGEAAQMEGSSAKPQTLNDREGQYVSDPTKLVSKPTDVNKWTPTLAMPDNYIAPNVSAALGVNPATGELAEGAKQVTAQAQNDVNNMESKARSQADARLQLTQLIQQFDAIPQGGITDFGAGNARRNEILAKVNGVLGVLGADKIDAPSQGFYEAAKKGTFNLGAKVTNSIGTREPGTIVNQAVQSQPGTEMSRKGIDIVTGSMMAQNDYDRDKAQFFRNYVSRFKTLEGADAAFEQYNPVSMYANRGLLNSIPADDRKYLASYIAQNPDKRVYAIRKFESTHGLGTGKLVLGQ